MKDANFGVLFLVPWCTTAYAIGHFKNELYLLEDKAGKGTEGALLGRLADKD